MVENSQKYWIFFKRKACHQKYKISRNSIHSINGYLPKHVQSIKYKAMASSFRDEMMPHSQF
jgi:hypothetical protein